MGHRLPRAAATSRPATPTCATSEPDATAPSPETAVLTDVDDRLVWQHFATLPERCKALLRAIAFAEKPDYASVALALGMPVGSIGPTRGRCLAKLRLALVADPRWEMPS